MFRIATSLLVAVLASAAYAQTEDGGPSAFDACGILVRGTDCVLFDGGGGKYVVSDAGRFRIGDAVRVVGTLDPNCQTICAGSDGCIRGAELYDPAVYPCGQPLPNFPTDIVTNVCSAASLGLLILTLAGLSCTGLRRAARRISTTKQ
jgi:hypothetical protein